MLLYCLLRGKLYFIDMEVFNDASFLAFHYMVVDQLEVAEACLS